MSQKNILFSFLKSFTNSLAVSFEHLTTFFSKDERENLEIHSLVTLGGIGIAMPFIIKAYKFGLPIIFLHSDKKLYFQILSFIKKMLFILFFMLINIYLKRL